MTTRRRGAVFRVSESYGDIVLLALLAGAAAKVAWHGGFGNADWLGFVYVGGDIAGLLSYFGFILFGALYYWRHSAAFWRTMHPLNFGLTLIAPGLYRYPSFGVLLAVGGGAAAAILLRRTFAKHPRRLLSAFILFFIFSLMWRWGIPSEWRQFLFVGKSLYAVAFVGGFLIFIVLSSVKQAKQAADGALKQEINEHPEYQPNDIDKMPIPSDSLKTEVTGGGEMSGDATRQNDN